ncbi:alpha/beta hydrolase [Cellulomonas sp. NPDC089187]|uniref:alpha/beta fold hydrolase n=1 Tax=Cellulomonas sp. NPDC089187 TaxID=3154970 RepID=UPI0034266889
MTTPTQHPTLLLIPGYWLGEWAWEQVTDRLTALGHRAIPLTLPGLDPDDPQRASHTLDDQAAAIEHAMDAAGASGQAPVILVGHSGANAPISMVLDRHPELVARVVWVDSGPVSPADEAIPDGPELDELPLPPFDQLAAQSSLDGLTPQMLDRFRQRAVPEPGPVIGASVPLRNDARRRVPTTLVCCSILGRQVRELVASGHPMFAEVAHLTDVQYVDLPTGHWPMWSRPDELARILAEVSRPAGDDDPQM